MIRPAIVYLPLLLIAASSMVQWLSRPKPIHSSWIARSLFVILFAALPAWWTWRNTKQFGLPTLTPVSNHNLVYFVGAEPSSSTQESNELKHRNKSQRLITSPAIRLRKIRALKTNGQWPKSNDVSQRLVGELYSLIPKRSSPPPRLELSKPISTMASIAGVLAGKALGQCGPRISCAI